MCNATMAEYQGAVVSDGILVIKVKEHKTGKYGTAKLTLDQQLARQLRIYVEEFRPLMIEDGCLDPGTLFILPGSKPITKWSNVEAFMAAQLKMKIPTSTWARKIGTTVASCYLDTAATTIISTQMSHQASVAQKHYTLTAGATDAARAYKILEQLRELTSKPSEH